jgi:hypothetical protein
MTTEIERTEKMRQPAPEEVLQGVATMQAFMIGLLIASHIGLSRVKHIGQSSVDPVYLIQLEETDEAIAKAPKDLVTIEV